MDVYSTNLAKFSQDFILTAKTQCRAGGADKILTMPQNQARSTEIFSTTATPAEKGSSKMTEDRFPDTRHSSMDAGIKMGTEGNVIGLAHRLDKECSLTDESMTDCSLPSLLTRPADDSSLSDESLSDGKEESSWGGYRNWSGNTLILLGRPWNPPS